MQKILVSGATGFIGRYVIAALLENPDYQVIATGIEPIELSGYENTARLTYISYDLSRPISANIFDLFGCPDRLIHLAWPNLPNYDALFHYEENLPGSYHFIKSLIVHGLKYVTVTGTCFEYGMQNGCLSEDAPSLPLTNAYALAKNTLRLFLAQLQTKHAFELNWVRIFYLKGKGQHPNSLLPLLDAAIERGDSVFNMSGGEQLRDYLPVETAADYIVRIMAQETGVGIINCCSGVPISVRRLVETHLESRNATIKLNLGFYPYANYEPMAFWGDNRKLSRLLERSNRLWI
jgi:dTDP-6-deoxy-L-talose 4-dehydrogenase (NAD+)